MRGYGDDEPEVHRILNPGVRVYTNADRAAGIAQAVADGANVVVLDDAFQHRRAARHADIVLVSAERWRDGERVLPAGSLRESPRALRRATLVIVTHKVASPDTVKNVVRAIGAEAPGVPVASIQLRLDALCHVGGGASQFLSNLAGARVLAIAGVGDPESFFRQLESAGAVVTRAAFPDHHPFTAIDGEQLAARGEDHKYVVSTLKDSVKLRHVWPPKGPPLWYVSQAVVVSAEQAFIDTPILLL
jgi:tetraacyldisaccharide 4'-kinase